jgi:hypothetical protein
VRSTLHARTPFSLQSVFAVFVPLPAGNTTCACRGRRVCVVTCLLCLSFCGLFSERFDLCPKFVYAYQYNCRNIFRPKCSCKTTEVTNSYFKTQWPKLYDTGCKLKSLYIRGMRQIACWDCGFEFRRGHGCVSLVSVVCCQVEVSATG